MCIYIYIYIYMYIYIYIHTHMCVYIYIWYSILDEPAITPHQAAIPHWVHRSLSHKTLDSSMIKWTCVKGKPNQPDETDILRTERQHLHLTTTCSTQLLAASLPHLQLCLLNCCLPSLQCCKPGTSMLRLRTSPYCSWHARNILHSSHAIILSLSLSLYICIYIYIYTYIYIYIYVFTDIRNLSLSLSIYISLYTYI